MRSPLFGSVLLLGMFGITACQSGNQPNEAQANRQDNVQLSAPPTNVQQNAPQTDMSCASEIGAQAAANLVEQCIQVSPATHPPCNATNPCDVIRSEVRRGCDYLRADGNHGDERPPFCNSLPR